MKKIVFYLFGFGLSATVSFAGDLPPQGSQPLAKLLEKLENSGAAVVTEAEFDDEILEVTLVRNDSFSRVDVDPLSGEIIRERETDSEERPPAEALPLSEIVQKIDAEELGTITEIEFDDGRWEAELRNGPREIEVKVDPRNGEIKRG